MLLAGVIVVQAAPAVDARERSGRRSAPEVQQYQRYKREARKFPSWLEQPGMVAEHRGYRIPGGRLVHRMQIAPLANLGEGRSTGVTGTTARTRHAAGLGAGIAPEQEQVAAAAAEVPVYLSSYFLEQAGWEVPGADQELALHYYRYYPLDSHSQRASRGSGRDNLVTNRPELPGADRYIAAKGSGGNVTFGQINGEFDLSEFRRNGLAILDESLTEYIIAQMLARRGAPMVPHLQLMMLPDTMQEKILAHARSSGKLTERSHWSDFVAVQTLRDLQLPRESTWRTLVHEEARNNPVHQSFRQVARFLGFTYFFNFAHGAINNENVALAHYLDMGHITFGYPATSGVYRCTMCKGHVGSTGYNERNAHHDGWIGVLEHYHPQGHERRSYGFAIGRKHTRAIVREMLRLIAPSAKTPRLTDAQHRAMLHALDEQLGFKNSVPYESLLQFGSRLLGVELPGDVRPHRVSIGLRFILQVAALPHALAGERDAKRLARRAHERLLAMAEYPDEVDRIHELFSGQLAQLRPTPEALRPLYEQDRPTNVIHDRVRERLHEAGGGVHDDAAGDRDYAALQRIAGELVAENTAPIEVTPRHFVDTLESVLGPRLRPRTSTREGAR